MKKKIKQIYHSKKIQKLPIWNLQDLYLSPNSKEIQKDLKFIKKECLLFEKQYFRKILSCNSKQLYNAIVKLENIDIKIDKILSYAHLLVAENNNIEKNKIFFQQIQENINDCASSTIFFSLELNHIKDSKLKNLLKDKQLAKYKYWISNKRSFKPYQLDLKIEKLLQDKNITSNYAWIRLFDDTISNLKFKLKNKEFTSAKIFNLLSDKKYQTRKIAAQSIAKTLGDNIKLFSTITNNLAKDKSINDSWRKLPSPVSSRNLSNSVEDKIVDSLVNTVIDSYPKVSHRYYLLKAKWFGKKRLMYWDRNAPLPFQNNKFYSWLEAKEIVLNAYYEFNSDIGKIVEKFFDNSWIHAPPLEGKSPGAFAASTVASVHPYILVNFQNKARDVATLAHELGHGVHQYLAGKKQSHFNASTPLTLAETASVFGEMLTFKSILKQTNNKNKKALLANKVEDMLNTVVRQTAFYEFEKKIHNARKKSELSVNQICSIWMDVQKRSLGPAISFQDGYKYYWSYIPHFIHSPFYVYAYAFGDCLVNSLYKIYESDFKNFDKKYINLLQSGGSEKYDQLLKPFNLNLSKSNFWKKGISVITDLIDELEELS